MWVRVHTSDVDHHDVDHHDLDYHDLFHLDLDDLDDSIQELLQGSSSPSFRGYYYYPSLCLNFQVRRQPLPPRFLRWIAAELSPSDSPPLPASHVSVHFFLEFGTPGTDLLRSIPT